MFKELFRSLDEGNMNDFNRLFPACYEKLRYFALGVMKENEAAKDVVNEILEKILTISKDGRGSIQTEQDEEDLIFCQIWIFGFVPF